MATCSLPNTTPGQAGQVQQLRVALEGIFDSDTAASPIADPIGVRCSLAIAYHHARLHRFSPYPPRYALAARSQLAVSNPWPIVLP